MKPESAPQLTWDIFCNVVDNFGDIGVCWRLACNLAARGKRVRLWVDDVSPLAWMAPSGHPNVEVIDCKNGLPNDQDYVLGDVLVDTFDCEFAINLIATKAINTLASVIFNAYFRRFTQFQHQTRIKKERLSALLDSRRT
jgi:hypothetical protein